MDYSTYLILSIAVVILSLWAQSSVKSTYAKYSKVHSKRGYTGAAIAHNILMKNNITDVRVGQINGTLTDHYSPKEKIIRLSEGVHDSDSVAAIGIAAHEAGHAIAALYLKPDNLSTATIIPQGQSKGHTRMIYDEEIYCSHAH